MLDTLGAFFQAEVPMVSDAEGVTQPPVNSFIISLRLDHDSAYQHSWSSDCPLRAIFKDED